VANVVINDRIYVSDFQLNNIKTTFKRVYTGYSKTENKESNVYRTVVSAMANVAITDLGLSMSFDDAYKYIYDELRGYSKENPAICPICKKNPVEWNKEFKRYNRFCNDSACVKKAREDFKMNAKAKLGTDNPASLPSHQIEMQKNRSIAKEYVFQDGGIKTVLGMQEYNILNALERHGYKSNQIETPGPTFQYYHPILKKNLVHISDIFIPELNLIISGKDGIDNPNMHPNIQKDRLRAIYEYIHIVNNTEYNFVQIEGDADIKSIDVILRKCKDIYSKGGRYIIPPRVDLHAYGENMVGKLFDNMRYYFLLDSDGSILISWFSITNRSSKGNVIFEDSIATFNFETIFNNTILSQNLFYIEIDDYSIMNFRRDVVNMELKSNYQALKYFYSGMLDENVFYRKMFLSDIIEICQQPKSWFNLNNENFLELSKDIFSTDSINKVSDIDDMCSSIIDKTYILDSEIYIYHGDSKLRVNVFDHEFVIDVKSGLCVTRESKVNKPYNMKYKVTKRFNLLLYAILVASKGVSKLDINILYATNEMSIQINEIIYAYIMTMIYSTSKNSHRNLIIYETGYHTQHSDVKRDIEEFFNYSNNSINQILLQNVVYEQNNSSDIIEIYERIKDSGKKNSKIIKAFINSFPILEDLRRFQKEYAKSKSINETCVLVEIFKSTR